MPCCLAASSHARLLRVSDSCPTLLCQESGAPNSPPVASSQCDPSSSPELPPASAAPPRCASTAPAGGSSPGSARRPTPRACGPEASTNLVPVILDVTDPEQIAAAAARIEAESDGGLDGLVNNAGVAVPGPLETIPLEDLRHQLEVNLVAYVAVTQAMLPQIRRAEGRIVFLASIGGRIAFPFGGPYHASKFATEAIGDVFRQELRPWGIEVAIIEPGSIDTPIWERGQEQSGRRSKRSRRRRTCSTAPRSRSSAR